jgi:hypothetical protein
MVNKNTNIMYLDNKKNIVASLKHLLCSFESKHIKNDVFLDKLNNQIEFIETINNCNRDEKNKLLKIIANLEPIQNDKYSCLYLELAKKIPDLFEIKSNYGMTLLCYMSYGFDSSFVDCIFELSKHVNLWKIKEEQNNNTALHFLILSLKNFKNNNIAIILENLSKYPDLWKIKNDAQNTPLHELCSLKEKTFTNILLNLTNEEEKEVWIICNDSKITPLHYLCTSRDKCNANIVMKKLIKYEEIWSVQDEFLYTPLHIICQYGDNVYDEFISDIKIYPQLWEIKNKNGKTPDDIYRDRERDREYEIL